MKITIHTVGPDHHEIVLEGRRATDAQIIGELYVSAETAGRIGKALAALDDDSCHDCDGTGEVESHSVGAMAPSPAGRVETCERCEGTGSDLPRFDGEDMHPIGGDR